MRLTHTRLLVDDVAASLRFFRDAVGLSVSLDAGVYAEFDTGDSLLAIYGRAMMAEVVASQAPSGPSGDQVVVGLAVASVDETYARLREQGVDFVTEPHDQRQWVLRVAHFRDLDGHLFELYEPLESPSS
jgi:lactoylglutathione lyase